LHDAELRPVRFFAHELGIDRDKCLGRQTLAQFDELICLRYELRGRESTWLGGHATVIHGVMCGWKVRKPVAVPSLTGLAEKNGGH
jgi:hypothetical protein